MLIYNYSRDNKLFQAQIINQIHKILSLNSEYEYEKYIEEFEENFSKFNDSKYTLGVNSGTTSLQLALKVCGIKEGDWVILPSYTYIATALAVSNIGAFPLFVDVKEDTLTIDPQSVQKYLNPKVKAIIPVHIHGNPCDMDKILKIAKKHNLKVIEDCSHAHGAQYKNRKVGNFGIGCFSCHTNKILSTIGNAGLITVNDPSIYKKLKEMIEVKNDPSPDLSKRTPCRLDILQCAILKIKLPYIEKIIKRKREIALIYRKELEGWVKFQEEEKDSIHTYRDFVILTKHAQQLKETLKKYNIEVKYKYYTPLHITSYYKNILPQRKLPKLAVCENIFQKAMLLPISFTLTDKEVMLICKIIKKTLSSLTN